MKYLIAIKFNDFDNTEIYEFNSKEDREHFSETIKKLYNGQIEIATSEYKQTGQ
jgi:hypothetical protein